MFLVLLETFGSGFSREVFVHYEKYWTYFWSKRRQMRTHLLWWLGEGTVRLGVK